MASIELLVTDADRKSVAKAVNELSNIPHITYMSREMIAKAANTKETKVRAILQMMLDKQELTQYVVTSNTRRQRYYFTLTEKGKALI